MVLVLISFYVYYWLIHRKDQYEGGIQIKIKNRLIKKEFLREIKWIYREFKKLNIKLNEIEIRELRNYSIELEEKYSDLLKEWHPTKNEGLDPFNFSPKSNKIVWWLCAKNHEWRTKIQHRTSGRFRNSTQNHRLVCGFFDCRNSDGNKAGCRMGVYCANLRNINFNRGYNHADGNLSGKTNLVIQSRTHGSHLRYRNGNGILWSFIASDCGSGV